MNSYAICTCEGYTLKMISLPPIYRANGVICYYTKMINRMYLIFEKYLQYDILSINNN